MASEHSQTPRISSKTRGFDISVGQCKIAKISQNSEIEVQKKDPPFE